MPRLGTVNYHQPTTGRQVYHIDAEGVSGRLLSPPHTPTQVSLSDVRRGEARVSFEADGFTFVHQPGPEPLVGVGWRSAYDASLKALLKRQLGAEEVVVFDHTLRVDDPDATRQPARNVHTDYSPEGAQQRLVDVLGETQAAVWRAGHYAFVNVWRPVGAPINTAPLGFVRPSSVSTEDWVLIDLVYPDRLGHIMGLTANRRHEWVYLSKMRPDEVALFNIYDSKGRPSIGHSAVDLVEDEQVHTVRRSLESRTLIRYAEAARS